MSRFAERMARDLYQIADRATPSSTAWDSIRTRIDEQTDEPDMEVIMLAPDDSKATKRTWVTAGAVAVAAAVLVIIGIVALTGGEDATDIVTDPDVTGDTLEAEGIGQDFVEARDAWDGEAVGSLVADDAVIDDLAATADQYVAVAELDRATGDRYTEPECTATAVGPPVDVTCTYTMENAWSQALGVGPFTGSSFDFVIADGQIQQLTSNRNNSQFSPQVWDVFTAWLRDTHPADLDVMFERVGSNDVPLITPEAIALWEQHTTEFVSSQSNS